MNKTDIQKLIIGHHIEDIPDTSKSINYVWQGNGVWEVRKNSIGVFRSHIHKFNTPGLHSNLTEGFELSVPKIPASLLDVVIVYFRQIYNKCSSEVFVQFFYNPDEHEYIIYIPKQKVSPASVKYERNHEYEKGKIFVFEIHSHGNMGAFFSGTDDGDEKEDRFFGVIGKVESRKPELSLRLCIGGKPTKIKIDELFEINEPNKKFEFPQERSYDSKELFNHNGQRVVSRGGRKYSVRSDNKRETWRFLEEEEENGPNDWRKFMW